jgi:hypothetical protein
MFRAALVIYGGVLDDVGPGFFDVNTDSPISRLGAGGHRRSRMGKFVHLSVGLKHGITGTEYL